MPAPVISKEEAARLAQVRATLSQCPKMGGRPYAADPVIAARQLVVAEIVDAYRVHCGGKGPVIGSKSLRPLRDFYEGPSPSANRFYKFYRAEWTQLKRLGIERYIARPEHLSDLKQTITSAVAPVGTDTLVLPSHASSKRSAALSVSLTPKVGTQLFICGAFEPTALAKDMAIKGIRWMVEQGYTATPIALRLEPGGAHRDGWMRPPCDDFKNKFKGMYVLAGLYPGRTDCTIRHESLHSIYHQIEKASPATMQGIRALYARAMAADTGLIFNDEYYMGHFIHAGHPMRNENEFFASAAHAFTHHADRLLEYVNDPRTSKETRNYAIDMWKLLRDNVFQGRVFTASGRDPYK